jgi:hypothetical protein
MKRLATPVALMFVIVTRGLPGLGQDRRVRLGDPLLGGLVQKHERTIGIARPLVGFQQVFHGGHEGGITHFRLRCGLSAIALSLVFSTMLNSTTFSSSRRRLHRAKPSGAGEQARAISFASAAPSKIRGRAELGLYLRFRVASNPSSTSS